MSEVSVSKPQRGFDRLVPGLQASLGEHAWLIFLVFFYVALAALTLSLYGLPFRRIDLAYLTSVVVMPAIALVLYLIGQAVNHSVHVRPLSVLVLIRDIRQDNVLTIERFVHILYPALMIPLFASLFTSFKNGIPHIRPFAFDVSYMEFDRWLHFGRHPYEWLQPLLGYPLVTSIISYLYNGWHPLMFLILWWQILSMTNLQLRRRYLISFILTWGILGSFVALMTPAAGPAFYGYFVDGSNPYEPLLGFLNEGSLVYKNWSLLAQDMLMDNYLANEVATGGGISAMPSLHVGVAMLQALLGWQISRRMGWLLSAYCAVVLVGSVHMAWHYAIDGYVSILVVCAIWWGVGRFVNRKA